MLPYLSTCPYPPKSSTIRSTSSSFGTFVGPRSPTSHRSPSANARPDDPARRTSRRRLVPTETRRRPGNTTRGPPYDGQHRQTALARSLRRGLCSCNYSASRSCTVRAGAASEARTPATAWRTRGGGLIASGRLADSDYMTAAANGFIVAARSCRDLRAWACEVAADRPAVR